MLKLQLYPVMKMENVMRSPRGNDVNNRHYTQGKFPVQLKSLR
ncbi:MAG: hypothetical protein WBA13_23725 [Microcoleaceae cyanobacterium]